MKTNKIINQIGIILFLSLSTIMVADAQQVQLYDHPPSAEEMGQVLFSPKESKPEDRGLNFSPKAKNSTAAVKASAVEKTSVALPIEFAFNSAEIMPNSKPYLDEVGKMLISQNFIEKHLIIEGHTDAKGPDRYNQYLSERRARAVSNYLTQNYGVTSARLKVIGIGEARPLPGKDPNNEMNRRVELHSVDDE